MVSGVRLPSSPILTFIKPMNLSFMEDFLQKICFGSLSFTIFVFLFRISIRFFEIRIFDFKQLNKIQQSLPIVSNFILVLLLIIRWIEAAHFPLSNLFESLLFLTWTITFIHSILLKTEKDDSYMGQFSIILSPFALFTYSFAIFNLPAKMQKWSFLLPALQSNWLLMHVSSMIFSYAILLSGSLFSLLFLIYHQRPKPKM